MTPCWGFTCYTLQYSPSYLDDEKNKTLVREVAKHVKKYMVGTANLWYNSYAKAYSKMMSMGKSQLLHQS